MVNRLLAMIDRILSVTAKQSAIGFFLFGLAFGFVLGVIVFLEMYWHIGIPAGESLIVAAWCFLMGAMAGVPQGCLLLMRRYPKWPEDCDWALRWFSRWTPKTVSEICRHLTDAEKRLLNRGGAAYMFWGFLTLALPVMWLVIDRSPFSITVAAVLLLLFPIGMIWILNRYKLFLVSTQYAKEKNIRLEQIDFTFWRRR
jgi:hypothetical protein